MTATLLREKLHQQINDLPDEIVQEIANFTAFVLARRGGVEPYTDWTDADWQQFALAQFFRDTDEEGV